MMLGLLMSEPILFLLLFGALIYGITVHEFSHVFSAHLMGDDTGKQMGRLTLNPLAHLDFMGTLMLFFVGFGWGKPAPYNPYNLRYKKWGPAIVSLAGPLANIISLFVFGLIFKILRIYSSLSPDNLLLQFLMFLALANLILLVFNLIPIPPLDGSRVLFTLLPDKYNEFKIRLARNGPVILIFLLIIDRFMPGTSIFGKLFSWVWNLVYRLF